MHVCVEHLGMALYNIQLNSNISFKIISSLPQLNYYNLVPLTLKNIFTLDYE